MTRRVVITGLGTVNSLSNDIPTFWDYLCAGRSGVSLIEQFDTSAFKVHFGGEVKNFIPENHLEGKVAKRLDRFSQFALVAAISAVKDSGIDFSQGDPFRYGVIIGSGIGGLNEFEEQFTRHTQQGPDRISPFVIPKMIANSAAGNVSIHFNLMGHNTVISTACASAAHALGDALHSIRGGFADAIVAGGSEAAITPMGLGGFIAARAVSHRNNDPSTASRPFDKDRDGFVLSEGAGIVVLEEYEHARKRGANIYAEILGCGNTADAYHITAPHPEGVGASKAVQFALADAKLNPDQIDYVNAHGTSTQLGDEAETKALKIVFKDHAKKIAVSSTKSMIGHTLGASGGIELIACALSIKHGVVHPTINFNTPDPKCDLDYVPNSARQMKVRYVVSNSFGFGGHNCCLALGAV
ncbi:MAG: beta-ketoacyl-[acyl-carrier-protein] synthase II [Planctomycetota bacterium]|jgi:3-oxoacyl-[acyl-carrier-protein] synthase II|nr:MAG: beta-ketoacyl-[acyl-carrier-protein] synthase II [Planctomycetota bacterium]